MNPSTSLTVSQPGRAIARYAAFAAIGIVLTGCNTLERVSRIGEPPQMSAVQNPMHAPTYQPVTMPMPAPITAARHANSLWRPGSRAFFKDLRANQVGDIVTVVIDIQDSAAIDNETTRARSGSEDASASAFLGYEQALSQVLPDEINPNELMNLDSGSTSAGTGSIEREEAIELRIAAVITQVLPNGNLVMVGRQETRVNHEVRELQIAGVIRPQDIDNQNTVSYDKIAEARLAYGGRGTLSDIQQPRYGQELIDIIFPF